MKKNKLEDLPSTMVFNRDVLAERLKRKAEELEGLKSNWLAALGILLTLLYNYLTTTFDAKLGLQGQHWEAITGIGILFSLAWFVTAIWRLRSAQPFDDFFYELYEVSLTKKNRRIVFLFKGRDNNNVLKVLAYRDPVWGCYLLPNIRRHNSGQLDLDLATQLCDLFGGQRATYKAINLSDFERISYKTSLRHNQHTMYVFDFFLVEVGAKGREEFSKPKFKSSELGYEYVWLSIEELENDEATRLKNGDVIDHLKENQNLWASDRLPMSIKNKIAA